MGPDFAIIGGTGVGDRLAAWGGRALARPTPYGVLRGRVIDHRDGYRLLAVQRHAAGHRTPPHRVEFRAIAWGLRDLGVRATWSTAAVGGLRPEWPVGTIATCSDLLDPSGRRLTLHDRAVVHTDLTHPFDPDLRAAFIAAAAKSGVTIEPEAVYVNGDGPRYESPAEIEAMRRLGGDVVGMTAGSEAIVMREAGVPYACVAVVTNLAAGLAGPLSHEEVVDAMRDRGPIVLDLILAAMDGVG